MTNTGRWWVCVCGRPLYDHGRLGRAYLCPEAPAGRFESETEDVKYDPENGLRPVDAADARQEGAQP